MPYLPYLQHPLLLLPHLISLGLTHKCLNPGFVQLLKGPRRLRYLSTLKLEFDTVQAGEDVDLKLTVSEIENQEQVEVGRGTTLLDNCHSIWEMTGWNMPFGDSFKAGLRLAEEIEMTAREADVIVSTNLESVRQAFRRQLVEYHNRGIGRLYFYMDKSAYEDASRLADLHHIDLPVLKIDTKEKVERGKLEWYKIEMDEKELDGREGCDAFNLSHKESRDEK